MSSKKRKNDDEAGTSGTKVARYAGGGGEEGDSSIGVIDGDWAVRPGMIMEVKMRNFMCHQVKIEFLSIL